MPASMPLEDLSRTLTASFPPELVRTRDNEVPPGAFAQLWETSSTAASAVFRGEGERYSAVRLSVVGMALHCSFEAMSTLTPPPAASKPHRSRILRFCHLFPRPGLLCGM